MKPFLLALLAAAPVMAHAEDRPAVYDLGELQVTARARTGEALGGATISGETLQTFQKTTVDQALDLIPGVNGGATGGSRNERLVYVRGFDRFQTTLSVDGVRVFLPADNRIDFSRFLTADLAEVQVSKGYVSVIDGPGGLGGAINLVTAKPTRPFEARLETTRFFDGDFEGEASQVSGLIGGRRGAFYLQASGAYADRDHFTLSDDFKPTAQEDGGAREHSDSRDWRVNVKGGWQPNATDEYSLNFTRQEGAKNAPYHVTDTTSTQRYWDWPYWNNDSLSFLSKTKIGERLTLRSRFYANSFDNLLIGYDNATQTTQSLPRSFQSYYDDDARGGNLELDLSVSDRDSLKLALFARQDIHRERQDGFVRTPATGSPSANKPYSEPDWQVSKEDTYSIAAENRFLIGEDTDLILGASYDWTDLKQADELSVVVTGATVANAVITYVPVNFPLRDNSATNLQAAVTHRLNDAVRLHASVSSRTRFPTLFDRFSARNGTAVPNPDIREERAVNYEVGVDADLTPDVTLRGAVFYSDLKDALTAVTVTLPAPIGGPFSQTQNIGKGTYSGAEAEVTAALTDTLSVGGNYSYIHRELIDPTNPAFRPTGVPEHKAFAYAQWTPLAALTLTPSVEYAGNRWTVTQAAPTTYYRTGRAVLVNLAAEWRINDHAALTAGGRNLTDENYQLADGFPEAGRSFYAGLRTRF
jgi:iron complex outermembrane receptor protein